MLVFRKINGWPLRMLNEPSKLQNFFENKIRCGSENNFTAYLEPCQIILLLLFKENRRGIIKASEEAN